MQRADSSTASGNTDFVAEGDSYRIVTWRNIPVARFDSIFKRFSGRKNLLEAVVSE